MALILDLAKLNAKHIEGGGAGVEILCHVKLVKSACVFTLKI